MTRNTNADSARCISIHGLRYSSDDRVFLQIDDLHIAAGERVAIVGHNGAGKSTLIRILSGFITPSTNSKKYQLHGHISVLGQDLGQSLNQSINATQLRALRVQQGQVMQGLHLVARLSALENVLIGCLGRITGWRGWTRTFPKTEIIRAQAALDAVGLLAYADLRVDQLSGGERQKIAIARVLLQQPKMILADEPTAALDPAAAIEACQLLNQATQNLAQNATQNATLISVVHSPALLPLLADRVIGLKHGQMIFDLPLAQLDPAQLDQLYHTEARAA